MARLHTALKDSCVDRLGWPWAFTAAGEEGISSSAADIAEAEEDAVSSSSSCRGPELADENGEVSCRREKRPPLGLQLLGCSACLG